MRNAGRIAASMVVAGALMMVGVGGVAVGHANPLPEQTIGVNDFTVAKKPKWTATCTWTITNNNTKEQKQITGTGTGRSEADAVKNAGRDANGKVPKGWYKRHITNCKTSKK
ncbi:hypothetical protein ACL02S_21805 [Nocardia sp. 004]|uniref:hypothetical protein n=1 Tax=Nocardia sp. 004 TaxID=3385978 RepID=UPI00399F3594